MRVILTGATGYVGEGVLLAMHDDKRIEKGRPCGHSHVCSMKEMVNAMINVSTNGYSKTNIEARDIIKLGKNTQ